MVTNAQGATIRQINAVNEFGQPTSVRTGTINRTYSYTPYGMPTGRTMGNVMDMSYDFDVSIGNLTYREDNIQMCYEEFYYDSLNRLEYMDTDNRSLWYVQSQKLGLLYIPLAGIPSIVGCGVAKISNHKHNHKYEWYETWANKLSYEYLTVYDPADLNNKVWNKTNYPRDYNLNWYFYATLGYYAGLLGLFFL